MTVFPFATFNYEVLNTQDKARKAEVLLYGRRLGGDFVSSVSDMFFSAIKIRERKSVV